MQQQQLIYSTFYKAQDRFLASDVVEGYEPSTIQSYIDCSLELALQYEKDSELSLIHI